MSSVPSNLLPVASAITLADAPGGIARRSPAGPFPADT
jgi:hypothetical protein